MSSNVTRWSVISKFRWKVTGNMVFQNKSSICGYNQLRLGLWLFLVLAASSQMLNALNRTCERWESNKHWLVTFQVCSWPPLEPTAYTHTSTPQFPTPIPSNNEHSPCCSQMTLDEADETHSPWLHWALASALPSQQNSAGPWLICLLPPQHSLCLGVPSACPEPRWLQQRVALCVPQSTAGALPRCVQGRKVGSRTL